MATPRLAERLWQLTDPDRSSGTELWQQWGRDLQKRGCLHPRVVLHGGYGKRNLGDDAILEVLLDQIREAIPSAQITVVCHGPSEVCVRYGVSACHFASWAALKAILTADIYIIGGGGIINRINIYSGFRRLRVLDPKGKFLFVAAAIAKLGGARLHFHAIGATSFPDPVVRWLAPRVLNWADALTVRDGYSQEMLRSAGVRGPIPVMPDPVVGLEPAPPGVARGLLSEAGITLDRLKVGINFRYVAEPDIDNAQTIRDVARLVEWLQVEWDAQVIFLPFGRHPRRQVENDLLFARQVTGHLNHHKDFYILESDLRPAEMMAVLGQMDLCLLERLHSVILAASAGVPLISVVYDRKVAAFADMAGLQDTKLPLRQFNFKTAQEKVAALLEQQRKRISELVDTIETL
jgi:polysaccharide pyruvyl transferase WcaK-like protein